MHLMVDKSRRLNEYAGLCASCAHVRVVESSRGSVFALCQRSLTDPGFRRYPPLPVLCCPGYQNADTAGLPRSGGTHDD
jgi:hypothetical protein